MTKIEILVYGGSSLSSGSQMSFLSIYANDIEDKLVYGVVAIFNN